MSETRTIFDPFDCKAVEISNRLVDRLRGKYASGPHLPNGNPEFGWRQFQAPQIQHEAAAALEAKDDEITSLRAQLDDAKADHRTALDHLLARTHLVNRKTEEIERLQAALDKAKELPKWNDLPSAQRNAIADSILLPHPEERMQMAVEAYAAVRRSLLTESNA